MNSATATNLQHLQALLAASAAFPGLFAPGNSAAGLLASLPGGLHSALAMQGFQGLFGGGLPAAAAAAAAAAKIPANVMSPPAGSTPSPVVGRPADASSIIDFSSKRSSGKAEKDSDVGEDPVRRRGESSPLDLSGGTRKRDRSSGDRSAQGPAEKRRSDASSIPGWKASQSELWNGHLKSEKNAFATPDASKALERMTELSRLSGETRSGGSGGRQSAWQSHWLSKGADTAKDVLKCVWCKLSFESLAALTTHMKESKHCGVNASLMSSASSASGLASVSSSPSVASSPSSSQPMPSPSSHSDRPAPTSSTTSGSGRGSNHDLLSKDGSVQLPRKLVRGQDVWLGKGAEQTRQILKCMWCGQSFRSLAEMTTHMQQTQHYTNIISQEQIISWKAADADKGSSGGGSGGGSNHANHGPAPGQSPNQSHVNAVLTCKVCDQAFSSLKELSSHMVKNSHYKEHIMRSISETGGRRRQARDKRKKALPVRKLLELERAQQEARSQHMQQQQTSRELLQLAGEKLPSAGRISCEKCGEKIETNAIVEHIRQCVGSQKLLGTSESKSSTPSPSVATPRSESSVNGSGRKTPKSTKQSNPSPRASPMSVDSASGSDAPSASASTPVKTDSSSPSVLNAIEKLIEKSFDGATGKQKGAAGAANPPASNILRRLGIDENMDYSKPLMDPLMTVNMLRLYGYGQQGGQRERTTSEASSSNASAANNGDSALASSQQRDSGKSTPRSTNEAGSPARSRSRSNSPSANSPSNRRHKDGSPSPGSPEPDQAPASPAPSTISERSLRSATPATQISSPDGTAGRRSQTQTPVDGQPARSSLNALSSMFEGLSSTAGGSSGGSGGFNPLAALQKLCDKTETPSPASSSGRPSSLGAAGASGSAASSSSNGSAAVPNPGAILAFSWACNDAVMTDSIMKCAFCDTQFISKGAYRHHLSKMHFVKDAAGTSSPAAAKASSGTTKASSGASSGGAASASASPQPPAGGAGFDESPHSKFLKYTELAKQLSSKYV